MFTELCHDTADLSAYSLVSFFGILFLAASSSSSFFFSSSDSFFSFPFGFFYGKLLNTRSTVLIV